MDIYSVFILKKLFLFNENKVERVYNPKYNYIS